MTTPPITEDWAQHPALNLAMDGIAIYANWVSRVVLPIAFLWIHENRGKICKTKHWEELPDDVGRVVEAAFEIVQKEKYYKRGKNEFDKFLKRMEQDPLRPEETKKLNEKWTDISRRLRAHVHDEFANRSPEEARPRRTSEHTR